MKTALLTLAAVLVGASLNLVAFNACAGGSASSRSFTWNRTVTGMNGGSLNRMGSCATGAGCSGTLTITGVNSNVFTRQLSVVPNGSGAFNGTITLTGPNNTVTRTFTVPGGDD